jgi:hypothetical protein
MEVDVTVVIPQWFLTLFSGNLFPPPSFLFPLPSPSSLFPLPSSLFPLPYSSVFYLFSVIFFLLTYISIVADRERVTGARLFPL